jgi:hypothetical protein
MTALAVDVTFPSAPITSLQKRIAKGIEQLYYAKLFVTSPAYADGAVWRRWYDMGFHVAIFDPPPGTRPADRIRVRLRAPSPTPHVTVSGGNADALKDLESLVRAVDAARPAVTGQGEDARAKALRDGEAGRTVLQPMVDTLGRLGFEPAEIDDFVAMLQRGFDALTDDGITAVDVSVS